MPSEDHIPLPLAAHPTSDAPGPAVKCALCLRFLTPDDVRDRSRSRSRSRSRVQSRIRSSGSMGAVERAEQGDAPERGRTYAPVVVTLSQEAEAEAAAEAEVQALASAQSDIVARSNDGSDESRLCSRCWELQSLPQSQQQQQGHSIRTGASALEGHPVRIDSTNSSLDEDGRETSELPGDERESSPAEDPAEALIQGPSCELAETATFRRTPPRGLEIDTTCILASVASPKHTVECGSASSFSAILTGTAPSGRSSVYLPAPSPPTSAAQRQRDKQPAAAASSISTTPSAALTALSLGAPWPAPDPLLDIARLRVPSAGRGVLRPGALFRGTQTSGRSSYDVEVRILDISFPLSTLSGYLSISHLTDTHPQLTTFFSGEIIGPTYGFLTGPRYYAQATEGDDMRHWSRFPHFRRIRNELRRPGLTLPEPRVDRGMGRERSFCFMRWKERFLVPDHKVRDISGASFAGFYYIQVDLEPQTVAAAAATSTRPHASTSTTTTIMTSPVNTPPPLPRLNSRESRGASGRPRGSVGGTPPTTPGAHSVRTFSGGVSSASRTRSPAQPPQPTRRMSASAAERDRESKEVVPMLTGYYFHHQNSEPFQELSLRYVPQSGSGVLEMR